jgi:uncharacterized protein
MPRKRFPELDKLVIGVSNECNMSCAYCYANDGRYYSASGSMMAPEVALATVDWAAQNFAAIHHVQFFGGEATLNIGVVHLICEYFHYLAQHGRLDGPPAFGLTTNGYKLTEQVIDVLRRFRFRVTTSMDGPAVIHDQLRRTKGGAGTFKAIADNVHTLQDLGIEVEFECTYTAEHERSGLTVIDLMDFFHSEFGSQALHIPMAMPCHDGSSYALSLAAAKQLYGDAMRYSVRNLLAGERNVISVAARMLNSLTARSPVSEYCPAGTSAVTVNADGNVYPCFLLMDGPDFRIDNVLGRSGDWPAATAAHEVVYKGSKEENNACQSCWARPLCFGCLGEDLAHGCNEILRSTVPGVSGLCDFKRHLVEVFLRSVAEATMAEQLAPVGQQH